MVMCERDYSCRFSLLLEIAVWMTRVLCAPNAFIQQTMMGTMSKSGLVEVLAVVVIAVIQKHGRYL